MRILIICPRPPLPSRGGDAVRLRQLIDAAFVISDVVEIVILSGVEEEEFSKFIRENPKLRVHWPSQPRLVSRVIRAVGFWLRGMPAQVGYYSDPDQLKYVAGLSSCFDLVVAHLIRVAPYTKHWCGRSPILFEATDAISMNYMRRKAQRLLDLPLIFYKLEGCLLRRYESEVYGQAESVVFTSQIDAVFLGLEDKAKVIPNSVPYFERRVIKDSNNVILFIGNLRTAQNRTMLIWFMKRVYPKVLMQIGCQLRIAGYCPPKMRKLLNGYQGVEMVNSYASAEEVSKDCFVGICPMQFGAGIQNKVLDYLSVGLPVVTTAIGNEGINGIHLESLLVADKENCFVDSIVLLRKDSILANRIGSAGRDLVRQRFSRIELLDDYKRVLLSCAGD